MKHIALAIVQNSQNKVLIIQRQQKETIKEVVLSWAFPGGEIEINETPEQAAQREVKEETGYQVKIGPLISYRQHPQFPVVISYFAAQLTSVKPSPATDPDIAQIKWVAPQKIKNYFTSNLDPKIILYLKGASLR